MSYFEKVKDMVINIGYTPENENAGKELFTITDLDNGINSLVIDVEEPILVFEMIVLPFSSKIDPVRLLQMNREMVHGAFAVDDEKKNVIWRDTLELVNLDLNELQGSISSLSLAMGENACELIKMSKGGN